MVKSLTELYNYENSDVINRYDKDFPDNTLKGKEAFRELMNYFWLIQQHKAAKILNPDNEELNFNCAIHTEMSEIDDMWHTFLLFTQDYMSFCEKYCGAFIHHFPNVSENGLEEDQFEIDLTRYLSFIFDELGEETVIKWFS